MFDMDTIVIKGARQHNLKNINLEFPKNKDLLALQRGKFMLSAHRTLPFGGKLCP